MWASKILTGAIHISPPSGSRSYERFTASQILKRAQKQARALSKTERISLISSLMCSLFLGDYAPIDTSDAAGMNLMSLKEKVRVEWLALCLRLTLSGQQDLGCTYCKTHWCLHDGGLCGHAGPACAGLPG